MRFPDYLALSLRSLRRSRVRSLLTIFAIVIGATGITVMLTFVTSVKNLTVASFVKTGQILQIQVSQSTDMRYDPTGASGGYSKGLKTGSASTTTPLTPALEAKIASTPHVAAVAGMFRSRMPAISNINFNGKNWVVQAVIGYQPTGAINPLLLAGRDLIASDTGNQVLISKSYADVMGFSGKYNNAIGAKINLHTIQGYTGAGVNLPNQLPPMIQCKQSQQNQQNCFGGPTSGMHAIDIPAVIVGVLDNSDGNDQPLLMMPLTSFVAIYNQAQPVRVNYPSQQRPNQNCKPGTPCQPGNGNGGGGNQMPAGPGIVDGGWIRPTASAFITNAGGFDSFMAKADDITNVAEVASAISRFGVGTTTGLKALNDQKAQANIIGLVLGALGMIALLIASLGVMNTMIMSVLQRTREIGVMRALGARRRTIRRIFTIEATAIGFFGGLIGVTFGSIFVLVAKPIITKMAKSGSLTGATFTVPPWLMLTVIAGTSAIGFLSGYFPARRAANLDPVEALRYE
jgi:ABC-type antimicrobial peptide transport system permease subunit